MSDDSRFFAFLKERIGLDVTSVGEAIIERALRQRSAAAGAPDSETYWQLLQGSPDEQQALIEAVVVPETWFFRYPESFATLGRLAVERARALSAARPLRILSLPCSTGEEPYSIAMALFDAGLGPQHFRIDAIDISPLSIERAKRALYGRNSFRGKELGFRERYFTPVGDNWEVIAQIRDCVNFRPGNLLDPAMARQTPCDFVFCRNLVIYFDRPTQTQAFQVLKQLTLADGLLFIGPAEGNLLTQIGMRSLNLPQSFVFRHAQRDDPKPFTLSPPRMPTPAPAPLPTPAVSAPGLRSAAPAARRPFSTTAAMGAPPPASAVAPVRPRHTDTQADAELAAIARLANAGKSSEARTACQRFLIEHEPVAQVFYWLGLLSEVEGHAAEAQSHYRKALYLQPQHAEALAQLAALLAAQGDSAGAQRLLERAARGANRQGNGQ